MVAVTLHFEVVVSAGKVAGLQRVGMLSSLEEFSIPTYFIWSPNVIWKFKAYGSTALASVIKQEQVT